MHRRLVSWSVLAAATAFAGTAAAQDIERFRPAPGAGNIFTTAGAEIVEPGRLATNIWVSYGKDPLVRRDSDGNVIDGQKLIEDMTTVDLMATYGVIENLELSFWLPLTSVKGERIAALGASSGTGAGDLHFGPRYRLLGGTDMPLSLALGIDFSLPTGDEERGLGSASVNVHPKIDMDVRLPGVQILANLGFLYHNESDKVQDLEIGHELSYGVGAALDLGSRDYAALAEVYGMVPVQGLDGDDKATPLDLLLGLRARMKDGKEFTIGGGLGLIDGYGSPDYRLVAGYTYSPMADTCAVCGAKPPMDTDGDGIADNFDRCPSEPEDKDSFQDGDGCPDLDNDADGIPDTADKCPNEAEDKDGDADEDGCPESAGDRDQDGIADDADKCPDEAEDKDAFEDTDGCPDPDNDQDGVLDAADKCPMNPETKNGFEDADGCPDVKPVVQVTCEAIELGESVFFETGKYALEERSYPLLDKIADTLSEHPEIRKIRIDGHTDSHGEPDANLKLSTQRVWVVREYLAKKGIDKARLAYKGYGQTQPIDTNDTEEGRARNRRVEIKIVEADKRPDCP